eukprot:scaffold1289_cov274-Pinguiococcus_pyrenoidosus.AAC.20
MASSSPTILTNSIWPPRSRAQVLPAFVRRLAYVSDDLIPLSSFARARQAHPVGLACADEVLGSISNVAEKERKCVQLKKVRLTQMSKSLNASPLPSSPFLSLSLSLPLFLSLGLSCLASRHSTTPCRVCRDSIRSRRSCTATSFCCGRSTTRRKGLSWTSCGTTLPPVPRPRLDSVPSAHPFDCQTHRRRPCRNGAATCLRRHSTMRPGTSHGRLRAGRLQVRPAPRTRLAPRGTKEGSIRSAASTDP